jgi:hypothetical protein
MRRFGLPFVMSVVLVSGLSLTAAAGSATEEDGLTEAWNNVKSFTIEQKDKTVAESQRAMDNFDRQMEQLSAEGSKDASEMSQGWEDTKAQLSELRAKAGTQLERLGNATGETWEDVKQEFGNAVEELDEAYDNARNNVEK